MTEQELKSVIEAILYIAEEPVSLKSLRDLFPGEPAEQMAKMAEELKAEYQAFHHGVEIREIAGGLKMSTKPEHHDVLKLFAKTQRPPTRLSLSALETLACIAYKQPITLPEIQQIRGGNASSVIHTLLEKRLVTAAGRRAVVGRPILYKTTKEFLVHFGLKDLNELPTLKEFEEIASHVSLSSDETTGIAAAMSSPDEPQASLNLADPGTESLQILDDAGEESPTR